VDNILANSPIRQLPIYRAGYAAGVDVGLVYALGMIVVEQTRQHDAAVNAALDPHQHSDAARHQYCAGRLHAMAAIVGATFRNAAQSTHHQGGMS
jgi:hypothetical protein